MAAAATTTDTDVVARVQAGDIRTAARLISRIEAGDPAVMPLLGPLYGAGRGLPVVGITGAPGAGKSTLCDRLLALWRGRGERVAVLAVDPSSPLSGGAILGDRVRMARHNSDGGVFIRSMSARGALGGLSAAAGDALIVLDALPFDRILIETVGAGQNEVDILNHAQTVLVVQTPAGGDSVQAMKSGLLEIADVYTVNRMDAPGADRMLSQLLEIAAERDAGQREGWRIPVLKTQAVEGQGIIELDAALAAHRAHLATHQEHSLVRRRSRIRILLAQRLAAELRARYAAGRNERSAFEQQLDEVMARRRDPAAAVAALIRDMG
jgi:LAO/AO transport system kinase